LLAEEELRQPALESADLAVRTGEQQQVGEILEQVSEPAQPRR
jgi:hypothetical protein